MKITKIKKIIIITTIIFIILIFLYIYSRIIIDTKNKNIQLCNFFLYNQSENFNSPKKLWAMSFGGGSQNYHDAVFRIEKELMDTKVFNEIKIFTDNDLKKDNIFWKKNGNFIENNKRGYGYWIWKPYLILKTLEEMNDEDILIYLDSGCEIAKDNNNKNKIKLQIMKCEKYDILYTTTGHDTKSYTKTDLLHHLNMNNDEIKNSIQIQATIIFIKKTQEMINFIKDWYNISCIYNLIDDSPSKLQNDSSFIEHRHDQAIFSLLIKKYKLDNNYNKISSYPFLLSRKRSG